MSNRITFKDERGFTLVELAIVMIIIGLLIGGVLKGQELIANAQVTSTVAQIKGIDAATSTFRDMFDAVPGDMISAGTRVPNCAVGSACAPGAANGDRRVTSLFSATPAAEGIAYFLQLSAADLLGGINPNAVPADSWAGRYPAAKIGGGMQVAYFAGNATLPNQSGGIAANVRAGHYIALLGTPTGGVTTTGVITPQQAFRIDNKMDDGQPRAGSVPAAGAVAGANGCANATFAYNESVPGSLCNLYIRFQN